MDESQGPPRVTALVVSRNDQAALRRCLEHLDASTDRQRLEVLVVDDGSMDGSAGVCDDFPAVISLQLPKRLGWTRAVNIALRTAKGDMVLLLPQDVCVRPDTISRLADRLEAGEDTGAVCPFTSHVWSFPDPSALATAWRTGELPDAKHVSPVAGELDTDFPRNAPILVRRELLRAMNYLDQRFGNFWSDLEMCSRIRDGGKKIVVMTDVDTDRGDYLPPVLDSLEWTDSATGIGTWIGLHHGFMAGLGFRIAAAFHALGRGRFSAFTGILGGQKIDGNQD